MKQNYQSSRETQILDSKLDFQYNIFTTQVTNIS